MSDSIVPTTGTTAQSLFEKQRYPAGVARNCFSAYDKVKEKKCIIPPTTLKGVTIPKLWEAVFANKSEFLKRYHDSRKETDLEIGKWDYTQNMGSGVRLVSMRCCVDVPKAGTYTPLNQVHRFAYVAEPNNTITLIYHISSQTPEVPMGTTFRTESLFEITAASETEDCTLSVYAGCKKLSMGFTAIQYIANSRATKEMTQAYQQMLGMISEELTGNSVNIQTADIDDKEPCRDDSGNSSAGGEGINTNGVLFQGLLLVLAFFVAVSIMWHLFDLGNNARVVSTMAFRLNEAPGNGVPHSSSLNDALNADNTGSMKTERQTLTQDKALRYAARNVHIQSLRHRWLEQREQITALETSLDKLWVFSVLQSVLILLIIVKTCINMS
uniref:Uncharacterized protein TCIL3000_11_15780 n=1 Tax=Trypanosoma congolense (strain IL3000) TaxID=1068625 RepID=G0V345_TRYCI|nr:unnamed protein product [Trypanosoma congolense IL3000]